MTRRILTFFTLSFLIISCSKESIAPPSDQDQLVSFEDIRDLVEGQLAQGQIFHWTEASDEVIYSAGMHSDSVFSIGYTINRDFDMKNKIHEVDINQPNWLKAKSDILALIASSQGSEVLFPHGQEEYFPQLIVQLTDVKTISALRNHELVRYVEPLGFSIEDNAIRQRSNSGCSGDSDYNIDNDYRNVAPGVKYPWNFDQHNIEQAWAYSQGDNVRIAILDTGAGNSQDNLGSQFAAGYSAGRNIIKESTKYSGSWWWRTLDSPHDQCGHGTSMAGQAAGTRGSDGNAVGVAYKADLQTIRCVEDVIISTSNERRGVRDALKRAGNRSDTKIISMSLGTPFSSSTVEDGVNYAYNKGKLMFVAAGTSLSWTSWYPVTFPATLSRCVAVTGVKESSNLQRCSYCHDGPQVEFVVGMERMANMDRTSLSLALSGNQPGYVGGSSCATATTSGIAALVWSQNPGASRADVLNVLRSASENYPNKHSSLGWGRIDALAAVTGI